MTLRFVFIIFLFILNSALYCQHLSVDFQYNPDVTYFGRSMQTIDLSGYEINDFIAVSVMLEGTGVNNSSISPKLIIKDIHYQLRPFEEEQYEDKYVSELYYLPVSDIGLLTFEFGFNSHVRSNEIKGKIHVFSPENPGKTQIKVVSENEIVETSNCACDKPTSVPRNVWGATFGLNSNIYTPPASYTDVTHIIVHHSAGTNVSNNWNSIVASIFDYHVRTNGWQDIGYNWLIDPNGILYDGRGGGENVIGAHMCGYNSNTMGVCILGNFVSAKPTDKAISALHQLLAWKSCKDDITPLGGGPIRSYYGNMAHISGHRDGCAPNYTECPGPAFYAIMESLRQGTSKYISENCNASDTHQYTSSLTWHVQPNPTSSYITISGEYGPDVCSIVLTDQLGRPLIISEMAASDAEKVLDLTVLPSGIYFLYVRNSRSRFGQRIIRI
jgi:hypothetical protein